MKCTGKEWDTCRVEKMGCHGHGCYYTDEIVEDLLKYVDNFKYRTYFEDASPTQTAEGVVFRKNDMTYSFKVVSNKYLLKGGE